MTASHEVLACVVVLAVTCAGTFAVALRERDRLNRILLLAMAAALAGVVAAMTGVLASGIRTDVGMEHFR